MRRPSGLNVKDLLLYEDNHLLVLTKPGGVLVQGDATGDETLLALAKAYLKEKYQKPGNVYLGLVHRLDRVTSGVLVFARTSKAAGRLSQAFREGRIEKLYLALVEGHPPQRGRLEDRLSWDHRRRKAYLSPAGKKAILELEAVKREERLSLLLVRPKTGRKHQIRAQLAAAGFPILGDLKYGSRKKVAQGRAILLHAYSLTLPHPVRREKMTFKAPPPPYWPPELWPK